MIAQEVDGLVVGAERSLATLDSLCTKLKIYTSTTKDDGSPSEQSDNNNYDAKAPSQNQSSIQETVMELFTLLFDFPGGEMVICAKKCGPYLIHILSRQGAFTASSQIDLCHTCLLIISAMCNYEGARCVLVETTSLMRICIEAIASPDLLEVMDQDKVSMKDKIMSCLSCIVRGFVTEAVESGIVDPMIALLKHEDCISDQKGAAGIILSLIEPEKGQLIGARVLMSGVMPMLFKTLAKPIPPTASNTEKIDYRNLQIIGLRCVATVLRHQKLARVSASQFFVSEEGESHLKSVVEHANDVTNVSRWLFASEILVWLASEESCHGLLGRLGAKQALQKVTSQADPYGKWKTLVNQAVSVKTFPVLWSSKSLFKREQHAFLALWMNRYAAGGYDVSWDAYTARQLICSKQWIAFLSTLVASPDVATRKHAHAALHSLMGAKPETTIVQPYSISSHSQPSSSRSKQRPRNNELKKVMASNKTAVAGRTALDEFIFAKIKAPISTFRLLLEPIGLECSEEKKIVEALTSAKIPFHILLRSGIDENEINNALKNLALGTRLAAIDGIREVRKWYRNEREVVEKATSVENDEMSKLSKVMMMKRKDVSSSKANCFISYCWAQKEKVKIIRTVLEAHGVKCWMDENQIEGGDMLFEEIDEGISSSTVVVTCLSPEYSKSVNCNREFLLASDRKKATVPVIVEDLEAWPPRGNLGPLLAGKLYIRIYEEDIIERDKSAVMQQLVQSVLQMLSTSTMVTSVDDEEN